MKKLNIICAIMALLAIIAGSAYVVYRNVNKDVTPPVITFTKDTIECSIQADHASLTEGLSASDDIDGDLTSHILVNDIAIKSETESPNDFDISYIVFDSSNNTRTATRTLVYTDYHAPHFSISDALRFNSISAVNLYDYIGAEDCLDGDISSQITIEMGDAYLNAISFGTYSCTVSVTNSVGDTAELPLSFEIVDSTSTEEASRPKVVLTDYLVYLKAGESFDELQYILGVIIDDIGYNAVDKAELLDESTEKKDYGYTNDHYGHFILNSSLNVKTDLNVEEAGIYKVEYSYKHPDEGTKGVANLIVIVE